MSTVSYATTADFVNERLTLVRRDLDEILDRLTQDMMDYSPVSGMRTVSGQLTEIAITEMQIIASLKDRRYISDDEAKREIGDCDSLDDLKRALEGVREHTMDYLESLSPEAVEEQMGQTKSFRSNIEGIAFHEYYHVGQLTSYLWAMGDHPYEW